MIASYTSGHKSSNDYERVLILQHLCKSLQGWIQRESDLQTINEYNYLIKNRHNVLATLHATVSLCLFREVFNNKIIITAEGGAPLRCGTPGICLVSPQVNLAQFCLNDVPPKICGHSIEKVSHLLKSLGMSMLHRSPIPLARRGTASAPPTHQLFMLDPTLTEFLG